MKFKAIFNYLASIRAVLSTYLISNKIKTAGRLNELYCQEGKFKEASLPTFVLQSLPTLCSLFAFETRSHCITQTGLGCPV